MPYEQGRAHYEVGRHLEDDKPARLHNLTRAAGLFEQLGASFEVAQVQAALKSR